MLQKAIIPKSTGLNVYNILLLVYVILNTLSLYKIGRKIFRPFLLQYVFFCVKISTWYYWDNQR